ncbi:MAG TPA: exopolysaccharide biosynthesis protein [Wenzhouxiangellaceae bacterium]|nr:exopolysaccharide biosynthesis protein [Wenzhouxiangellaceae bacterium]
MAQQHSNLEQLLDQLELLSERRERVSLDDLIEAAGRRSFGTLLLIVGLILASPLSGIPGVATTMGVFVLLIALQLLGGRRRFWLPRWLLRRWVWRDQLLKAVGWLRSPARFIDGFLQPRLTWLVYSTGTYLIALVCVLLAMVMPTMELVPFSATVAGLALVFFGLSLVANDGLLMIIAIAIIGASFGTLAYSFVPAG